MTLGRQRNAIFELILRSDVPAGRKEHFSADQKQHDSYMQSRSQPWQAV